MQHLDSAHAFSAVALRASSTALNSACFASWDESNATSTHKALLAKAPSFCIVNPKKLETGLRTNSAGIPYTLLFFLRASFKDRGYWVSNFWASTVNHVQTISVGSLVLVQVMRTLGDSRSINVRVSKGAYNNFPSSTTETRTALRMLHFSLSLSSTSCFAAAASRCAWRDDRSEAYELTRLTQGSPSDACDRALA